MKYKFNTRWNKQILICACLYGNPCCDRYKKCEVIEMTLHQFDDVLKCMDHDHYERKNRALRQR